MARATTTSRMIITTIAAWSVALLIAFPVIWMILTSFKTEVKATNSGK